MTPKLQEHSPDDLALMIAKLNLLDKLSQSEQ